MQSIYVITFEKQMEVMTQSDFNNFLNIAVMHNKDITSFSVIDISRKPVPVELVPKIVGLAYLQKNINLKGGSIVGPNFSYMYLYEETH